MPRWFQWATAFFILQATQAPGFGDRLIFGEANHQGGDVYTQSINLLIMVVSIALFFANPQRVKNIQNGANLALAVAGLFFLSALWSIDPAISIREAVQYLFVVLCSIGIAANLDGDSYMRLLGRISLISAIASLGLFYVSPDLVLGGDGNYRGIFPQKNGLGEAMTMGALASLHGLRAAKSGRWRSAVSLIVVTAAAIRSESATSCLTIFVFCLMSAVAVPIRKGGVARVLAITVVVLVSPAIIAAMVFQDAFMEMIGKDPSLTGRTEIWAWAIFNIHLKPFLGWGYLAFWTPRNPAAMQIADALQWESPQAHNGLLEMLLFVGLIGTSYILFLWGRAVWLAVRCLRTTEQELGVTCLLSCVGLVMVGISETVLVDPYEASTDVFFITALLCEKALRAARVQQVSQFRSAPATSAAWKTAAAGPSGRPSAGG